MPIEVSLLSLVKQGKQQALKETKIEFFEILTKCYHELNTTPLISTLFLADHNLAIILAESEFEAEETYTSTDPTMLTCKLEDVSG